MLISAVVPFIAEPLRQSFISLTNRNEIPQDLSGFKKTFDSVLKDLPDEFKLDLLQAAKSFYNKKDESAPKSQKRYFFEKFRIKTKKQ